MYADSSGETILKQQHHLHHQLQQSIQHEPMSQITATEQGGSEHQKSLLSLIKLQTLDECEERWHERANSWQAELQQAHESNLELTGRLNHKYGAYHDLQKQLSVTQSQLESANESIVSVEVVCKKSLEKNKDMEQEITSLKTENMLLQNTIALLESNNKEHQVVVVDMSSKMETLQKHNNELILHQQQRQRTPEQSPRSSSQHVIDSLESQLRVAKEERDRFSSELQQLIYQKTDLEKENTAEKLNIQRQVHVLQNELRHLATLNETHLKETSRYKQQESQLRQVRNALSEAASDIVGYKEQLCVAQKLQAIQQPQQESVSEVEILKGELKKMKKELKSTTSANNHLLQEKSEWKYKALLAKPSSTRCRNCDSRVTLWPQPYQQVCVVVLIN